MAPRMEIRLVLPLPEGPEMTVKIPGSSARSMPWSANIRAAPDPKPSVTARISTLCTKYSPRIDAHRRPRRDQRGQNTKQRKRTGDDEIHPIGNRHPSDDGTGQFGVGLDKQKSEHAAQHAANQRLNQND